MVLELVDGETLADRITRGPLSIEETLSIAYQVCEALEAAHEKGVIHRDLKPANVKITPEGKVKVLDFGLAKAMDNAPANTTMSNSPTLSLAGTMQGMILGTATYMSPEQAKGFNADPRSDIFSFGCVLYEMLTGKAVFDGDTVSEILASVLKTEPGWNLLPNDLNPKLCDLLRRCLEKNPRRRWYAIGDVRVELDAIRLNPAGAILQEQPAILVRPFWKRASSVLVAMVVGILIAGVAFWSFRSSIPLTVTKFPLLVGDGQAFTTIGRSMLSISPDGTQMVYVANRRLYLRSMSELEARPILGTENPMAVSNPVFSPDGRYIAFWSEADQALKKIAVTGGALATICQASQPYGVSWSSDGIVFNQGNTGHEIVRVSANGGKPELLVSVTVEEGTNTPQILPGGESVLFTVFTKNQIAVQSLKSGVRKTLIEGGAGGRYVPTGHMVYAVGGNLLAVPFDLKKLEVTGGAIPIVEGVRRMGGGNTGAQFSFSDTGSLVYVPGPAALAGRGEFALALIDRSGGVKRVDVPPKPYGFPRISPEGRRVAFGTDDGKEAIIWIYDLAGTSAMRRLTLGGANRYPVWSADGERIAFQSDREGDFGVFWQRADGTGTAERLTKPEQGISHIPDSWSPDGQIFSFTAVKGNEAAVWVYSLKDRKTKPFAQVASKFLGRSVFSPDGQWLAYQSNETTLNDIFVQPFPATGTKYQVSKDDNNHAPLWSPDGNELFYLGGQGRFRSVRVTTKPSFTFSNPVSLPTPGRGGGAQIPRNYDIMRDGKQFIGIVDSSTAQPTSSAAQINVVLNWFSELQQRVPVK